MIKLFSKTDTSFSSNGDKIIIPLRVKVHKEDNGSFYLDFECSLDYINDIVAGNIIVAPTPQGEQAFRISSVTATRFKLSAKCYHVFYDSNKGYLTRSDQANRSSHTFTPNANWKYLRFWVNIDSSTPLNATNIADTYNVQMEEGTKANSYTPYGTTPLEYGAIGDYEDEFIYNTTDTNLQLNKWYLKKNIGKIDSYNGETITTTYISTTGGLDTGATIYYALSTPQYILLNNTLQEQLDIIESKLLSYKGSTNISQVNNDLPFVINSSALKDLNTL